jgi:2-keto-4-pentenoate hydratase/2-oxohepta-3-ene-1,7-dioic acid hydratase in catechol pathway
MRLVSYDVRGRTSYGAVVGEGVVDLRMRLGPQFPTLLDLLHGQELAEAKAVIDGVRADYTLADVELRSPVVGPEKILCIGVNYANRNEEYKDNSDQPKYPSMFFRTPGSFVGHERPIIRPKESVQLDYEGEIALVIGKGGRRIPKETALDHIAGLTLANEGTIRDWLRHGKFNVTQGKNFDATGSIGPWMVTVDEVDLKKPMHLTTKVNGEIRQSDSTANMIFDYAYLLSYISTFSALTPGDIILTGTPTGAGARFDPPRWLAPGDVLEIEVPEIGILRNTIVDEA